MPIIFLDCDLQKAQCQNPDPEFIWNGAYNVHIVLMLIHSSKAPILMQASCKS